MDNLTKAKIGRFDQVRLRTTKNVSYLSAPPGTEISPKGLWSVVSILADIDLLLARNSALIRIPIADVLLVAGYDINRMTKDLGRLSHGEEGEKGNTDRREQKTPDRID